MPTLTTTQLNELQLLQDVTLADFKTAYQADPDDNYAVDYYEYIEGKGFKYGTLALGVVQNNTDQGKIANGYAEIIANQSSVNFSVGSDTWGEIK